MKERSLTNVKFVVQALHQSLSRLIVSVHEEKKLFKCDICDASFSEKNDLKEQQFMTKICLSKATVLGQALQETYRYLNRHVFC